LDYWREKLGQKAYAKEAARTALEAIRIESGEEMDPKVEG